jgi:hypothetical protein
LLLSHYFTNICVSGCVFVHALLKCVEGRGVLCIGSSQVLR